MAISDGPVLTDTMRAAPLLEIVVPVHNEEAVVVRSIDRLTRHLADELPFTWQVTIVDNASTDGTLNRCGDTQDPHRRPSRGSEDAGR